MKIITDYECCPHCGDTFGYYSIVRSKGTWHDNTWFDHVTKENTEMMDSFTDTYESVYLYCCRCEKRICKRQIT